MVTLVATSVRASTTLVQTARDFVALTKFDSRPNQAHGVAQIVRKTWGATKVVIFPARAEAHKAYDERREIATSSPLSVAANDLLARILERSCLPGRVC